MDANPAAMVVPAPPSAAMTKPALTSIKQPVELMVKKAYEAVTENTERTLSGGETIIFNPELVIRESA